MKALDTNVLIRFLTKDDPKQSGQVKKLFEDAESTKDSLFVSSIVVVEVIWVLECAYQLKRDQVLLGIENLVGLSFLVFEHEDGLSKFLAEAPKCKTDLSDLLIGIISEEAGANTTLTFDKKASKHDLFTLLKS